MNQQLFNVFAQKTRGNPLQTVKNMSEEERCGGAGALGQTLLRAHKGKNTSRSQRLTERVHDIKRVSSYSEVLARKEMWEAALKEHVKDTGCDVADITMANCLRRLVPANVSADLQKMSHFVSYIDVKKYIMGCGCVTIRCAQIVTQMVSNPWIRVSLNITMKKSQERHVAMSPIFKL